VVRLIEPVNCVLQRSLKSKPFVVHFDKLKKCLGPTPKSWLHKEGTTTEEAEEPRPAENFLGKSSPKQYKSQDKHKDPAVSDLDCDYDNTSTRTSHRRSCMPNYFSNYVPH